MAGSFLRRFFLHSNSTHTTSTHFSSKAWGFLIIGLIVTIAIPLIVASAILLSRKLHAIRQRRRERAAEHNSSCPEISPGIYTQRRETFYRRQRQTMQGLARQSTAPASVASQNHATIFGGSLGSLAPIRHVHGMPGQDFERGIAMQGSREALPRYSTLGEPWEDIPLRELNSQQTKNGRV